MIEEALDEACRPLTRVPLFNGRPGSPRAAVRTPHGFAPPPPPTAGSAS